MLKLLLNCFKTTPAIFGILFLVNAVTTKPVGANELVTPASKDPDVMLQEIGNYNKTSSMGQVTSVSQLRDVSPTDWAYEALRSLVERYGCIVGYPDRTFRGNRALSRYEFAAGLNACMQQMERLLAQSMAVLQEDIELLKRLMREFEIELAYLGARVDNLEGRVAFLEDHQFSTTTKLGGEVIFALTQNFAEDNQAIFADRVRIELNTSFSGTDRLVTRLAAGNAEPFEARNRQNLRSEGRTTERTRVSSESATLNQTFNLYPGEDNDVQIDWLAYYLPIQLSDTSRLNTYIAAFGGIHSDYVPTINPYFEDFDNGNGALSTFASENPIYRIGGGAGAAIGYEIDWLESLLGPSTATVSYFGGSNANSPRQGEGLFNGDYSVLGQFNVNFSDSIAWGVTFVHGFHKSDSPIFGSGTADGALGIVGTPLANGVRSQLDDLVPDTTNIFPQQGENLQTQFTFNDKISNSIGTQFAWRINESISFSAFFTYGKVTYVGRSRDNNEIFTYGGGFAFPDLWKEGNLLGIFAGVQPYTSTRRVFLNQVDTSTGEVVDSARVRFSNNITVPVHVEAFYKYQVTDNVSLTPGVIWVSSPLQGRSGRNSAVIGTLRGTFSF